MPATPHTESIELGLEEIDILLNLFRPHASQDLGKYADAAKAKLNTARSDWMEFYRRQQTLFEEE